MLKRALKTCKRYFFLKTAFFLSLFPAFFALFSAPVFSQGAALRSQEGGGTQAAPQAPSVSMPSMPTVSLPSLGKGFYVPKNENFYKGQTGSSSSAQNQKNLQKAEISQEENSSSLSGGGENSASELKKYITAGDFSALSSLGLFDSVSEISGLAGQSSRISGLLSPSLSSAMGLPSGTENSVYLQKILFDLEELKKTVSLSEAEKNSNGGGNGATGGAGAGGAAADSGTGAGEQSILRFLINGQDFKPACKTVFFSKPETDGTFLVTGDCRYELNGKILSETFYILFRSTGTKNGSGKFTASPALSQPEKNESSFLYKICSLGELDAYKTGNLMTLKASKDGVNLDLLLSL